MNPSISEEPSPLLVVLALPFLVVVHPIDLHGERSARTVEIEDDLVDRMLPTKPMARELAPTEQGPEKTLGVRGEAAERSSTGEGDG